MYRNVTTSILNLFQKNPTTFSPSLALKFVNLFIGYHHYNDFIVFPWPSSIYSFIRNRYLIRFPELHSISMLRSNFSHLHAPLNNKDSLSHSIIHIYFLLPVPCFPTRSSPTVLSISFFFLLIDLFLRKAFAFMTARSLQSHLYWSRYYLFSHSPQLPLYLLSLSLFLFLCFSSFLSLSFICLCPSRSLCITSSLPRIQNAVPSWICNQPPYVVGVASCFLQTFGKHFQWYVGFFFGRGRNSLVLFQSTNSVCVVWQW